MSDVPTKRQMEEARKKTLAALSIRVVRDTEEVVGILGSFDIIFRNYYWVVIGRVPLATARRLYASQRGRDTVRAGGDAGRVPPEGYVVHWYTAEGKRILPMKEKTQCEVVVQGGPPMNEYAAQVLRENVFSDEPSTLGAGFVETYHIDSDAGLTLFVERLRQDGVA